MKKFLILLSAIGLLHGCNKAKKKALTNQKKVVETYVQGFNEGNHSKILSCLTENVIWEMPGYFHLRGKKEFDSEIENDAFTGRPEIVITRLVEEDTVVVAEGTVRAKMKNGSQLDALFCDVFHFDHGKITKLTTYLMHRGSQMP